jgi:hypothetical protein
MRRTRLVHLAVVLLGVGIVVFGVYLGLFGPKPHEGGRHAIAVIETVGGGGKAPTVSLPKPDGTRETVELRDPARAYEERGPVNVLVENDNPAVVYDANGGRSNVWLLADAGVVLMASSRYLARATSKIGTNRGISH